MLRSLYRWLIWAHPRPFRREFGGEMIWIFDQAADHRTRMSLLADCFVSVLRQRWMRPVLDPTEAAVQTAGVPAFTSLDGSLPPIMLVRGAVVSVLLVAAAASAPGTGRSPLPGHGITPLGGGQQRASAPVSHSGFARQLQRIWSGIVRTLRDSPSSAPGLVPALAAGYSQPTVPTRQPGTPDVLLGLLDADGDLVLTRAEMVRAPDMLRLLDADFDGLITWHECETGRDYLNVTRRSSRLFGAIDSTGSGVISRGERLLSADALAKLDADRDGRITRREWEEQP